MADEQTEDITLRLTPGATGAVEVRITPQFAGEMEAVLTEAGIYRGRKIELSAEVALAVVLAGGGAAALRALHPVLVAWLNRHQHTKVEMYENGRVQSVSGTSVEKAQRVIDHYEKSKSHYEQRMAEIDEEIQRQSFDPGDHRPGGPATGE